MGARLMTDGGPGAARGNDATKWRLQDCVAKDVQGLVVSGFSKLPFAKALFLNQGAKGGTWIKALREVAPITSASGRQESATILSFTRTGLVELGLKDAVLATFQRPFREGMHQADRRRRLGDLPASSGQTKPAWSACTVHALLLLYDETSNGLFEHFGSVRAVLDFHCISIVREIDLVLSPREKHEEFPREHFGFADGISQPMPYGDEVRSPSGAKLQRDPLHGVRLGEILLGYKNAYCELPPGPAIEPEMNDGVPTADLKRVPGAERLFDLGLNGSYLVVRELDQNVPAFWHSLDQQAAALTAGGALRQVTAEWLAERIVGRDIDGNILCPWGVKPRKNGRPDNDFLFFKDDRLGLGCPLGSHVRRANPRDGLAMEANACADLLDAANNHRLLRRARKFGPPIKNPREPDGKRRGLLFMCLNTDIERQFEFVQQSWILNPHFATLFNEVDPLLGPDGPMTLPREPMRLKIGVQTYVTFVGGEYFFMPSLRALSFFEKLPTSGAKP